MSLTNGTAAPVLNGTRGQPSELANPPADIPRRLAPPAAPAVDENLYRMLYDLQAKLRQASGPPLTDYDQLVGRIREVVRRRVPPDGGIAVVSKGDDDLLNLYGRRACHFPQKGDTYAGFYPGGDTAAIAHLEFVRSNGAEYLLIPNPARWWLSTYRGLRDHLGRLYELLVDDPDACLLYRLTAPSAGRAGAVAGVRRVADEFEGAAGREPFILDWGSGLDLAQALPDYPVFSPIDPATPLPYADRSADVVVIPAGADEGEARRVAAAVVLRYDPAGAAGGTGLRPVWRSSDSAARATTVSIVIPVYNGADLTARCLRSVADTLPAGFAGEVIVVDDNSTDETREVLAAWAKAAPTNRVLRNPENLGFLGSANRGAAAATGDVLVFLNNDTVLLPGWLPPLVRTFREHPDAGAVGGRLVWPNGELQEAGGIIFRDGSTEHFGRHDFCPDAPLYTYLREVDYCSGALLATPRRFFDELGRFDPAFAPGYYEDTDFCMRVREAGRRVYYQPESRMVHFEGGTSGNDLTKGMRRHMVLNKQRFLDRWAVRLKSHPARPQRLGPAEWHALAARG